ncbi:hypothetical protein [Staphylococcus pseudoxylosus]|uniref:hypothetical protein n=1 Tax=Staphylococcus pseudoxylosus TaxID=2282419 RepID=UPI001939F01A|nr:hypothetical protein [Staphylococcus pseudoxylosus]MBM2659691.1 hypothetical protein [Staphylococcus pseudoxylosus]
MNEPTEIKYPLDENGEPYFAATHADAISNSDKILKDLINYGGWVKFAPINGNPNSAFKATGENGFDCSYRVIEILDIKIKTIQINLSDITDGMTIHNFPKDFAKESQSWLIRVPGKRYPATISLRPNGRMAVVLNATDRNDWTKDDYIYGSYTWIEKENE